MLDRISIFVSLVYPWACHEASNDGAGTTDGMDDTASCKVVEAKHFEPTFIGPRPVCYNWVSNCWNCNAILCDYYSEDFMLNVCIFFTRVDKCVCEEGGQVATFHYDSRDYSYRADCERELKKSMARKPVGQTDQCQILAAAECIATAKT